MRVTIGVVLLVGLSACSDDTMRRVIRGMAAVPDNRPQQVVVVRDCPVQVGGQCR